MKRIKKKSKKNYAYKKNHSKFVKLLHQNRKLRPVLIAVTSSLVIGLTFGFIFLSMVKQEESQSVDILNSSTVDSRDREQKKDALQKAKFDPISFYVVQAGVFSDEKNANEFGKTLSNVPYVVWEMDGQFYLFTGIALSENKAKTIAEKMKEQEIDVYVKEWNIEQKEVEVVEEDERFIQAYLELWKRSLSQVDERKEIAINEWSTLVNEYNVSEQLTTWKEKIDHLVNNNSSHEILLLKLIYEYDVQLSSLNS